MSSLFPVEIIASVRCPKEGGALRLNELHDQAAVSDAGLSCAECGSVYRIEGGILRMFSSESLDSESRHEVTLRDSRAAQINPDLKPWWENPDDEIEVASTLRVLNVRPDEALFELGCGDGRYTVHLAGHCRRYAALDFSIASLQALQRRLPADTPIGLIHADVTVFKAAAGYFDKVFSTLVSNLPTLRHRNALYALAAAALKADGEFLYSVHHFGIKERLRQTVKSGYYGEGDIYRYLFTARECRDEALAHFGKAALGFTQIYLPFSRALRLPIAQLSKWLERVPVVAHLGALIMCTATNPRRLANAKTN